MSEQLATARETKPDQVHIEPFDEEQVGQDPVIWLKTQGKDGMIVLAHADDGVIWGRVEGGDIQMPPLKVQEQAKLRKETLQMARLFDDRQEILLWRTDEGKWRARTATDGTGEPCEYFDEAQVLWGTKVELIADGFARVADGEQGLRHAPPLPEQKAEQDWNDDHPLRLRVRHYLTEDEEGWVRIGFSRLIGSPTTEVTQ